MSSKSTFSSSTSESYALALYELAKDNSELDRIESEIKVMKKIINESPDFEEMILSPTVIKEDKQNVILKIADKNNFADIFKNFLGLIAMKNRLFFLNKIIESYLNLVSTNKGELKANFISSKKLTIEEQDKIQSELSKDFKSPININYKYNPNLIAGLIIQIGSIMVDTSIQTKLKKLEKNMVEI